MICVRCNKETKKARPVAGYIFCNKCYMDIINLYNEIKLTSENKTEKEELDWFERCRLARLNSEMDGQPLSDIFW